MPSPRGINSQGWPSLKTKKKSKVGLNILLIGLLMLLIFPAMLFVGTIRMAGDSLNGTSKVVERFPLGETTIPLESGKNIFLFLATTNAAIPMSTISCQITDPQGKVVPFDYVTSSSSSVSRTSMPTEIGKFSTTTTGSHKISCTPALTDQTVIVEAHADIIFFDKGLFTLGVVGTIFGFLGLIVGSIIFLIKAIKS